MRCGIVRELLAYWLEQQPRVRVAACVGNVQTALAVLSAGARADVVVHDDCDTPEGSGWLAAAKQRNPALKTLALAGLPTGHVVKAKTSGHAPVATSIRGIAQILSDLVHAPAAANGHAGGAPQLRRAGASRDLAVLSRRELQVLHLTAAGLTKKQMAHELGLSVKTVENVSARLMNKLGIHDRVQLARLAIREGLVAP